MAPSSASSKTATSLCRCGRIREKRIAGPYVNFPGRAYYRCDGCHKFDWACSSGNNEDNDMTCFDKEVGPVCKCGKASVQRTLKKEGHDKGRKFWGCASWPKGCGFFQFQSPPRPELSTSSFESTSPSRPGTKNPLDDEPGAIIVTPEKTKKRLCPGFASYLSDWKQVELVQKMMNIRDSTKLLSSLSGCCSSLLGGTTKENYDQLEVVGLWHITNPTRMEHYQQAKERIKKSRTLSVTRNTSSGDNSSTTDCHHRPSKEFTEASEDLGIGQLDKECNEVFLLHGTDPKHLFGILFEGLDPQVARNGLFGRGVYFADDATKIDQYTGYPDLRYEKNSNHPLHDLHERLYHHCTHPKNVRYALVCRVLLGTQVMTKDGITQWCSSNGNNNKDDYNRNNEIGSNESTPVIAQRQKTNSAAASVQTEKRRLRSDTRIGKVSGSYKIESVESRKRMKLDQGRQLDVINRYNNNTTEIKHHPKVKNRHKHILFTGEDRSELAKLPSTKTPDSLLALPGQRVPWFREYVIFQKDQIFVEYLVAYHRIRQKCDCGIKCLERTVTKMDSPNSGRTIHFCGNIYRQQANDKDNDESLSSTVGNKQHTGCNFIRMFPLCYCNESAHVMTSHSVANPNRMYYCCHWRGSQRRYYRGNTCDFFQWKNS